jgi:hypothetical protein
MASDVSAAHITEEMALCISLCADCHDACAETAGHCLARGARYAEPELIDALLDCQQLCDLARDTLLRGSPLHGDACGLCADACLRCAAACEALADADPMMDRCAELSRRCADSCRRTAER